MPDNETFAMETLKNKLAYFHSQDNCGEKKFLNIDDRVKGIYDGQYNKDTDEFKICSSDGVMETDNKNNDKINNTNNDNINMNSKEKRGLSENNEIEDTGEDIEKGNKVWMNKDGNEIIVINDNNMVKETDKVLEDKYIQEI
ncbi:unnamed protein product [Gordionus sp. m RMFG-2023]